MPPPPRHPPLVTRRAFTLVEILIAISILALVLTAIFSSWTAILRASKTGRDAAAAVQRARMAGRILEEALSSAQYVEPQSPAQRADPLYYFDVENGAEATLSFISQLSSKYFPRSVKFGPWTLRRVIFSVRPSPDGGRELVLAQKPLLWAEIDEDEKNYPLVLAKNVKEFKIECYDDTPKPGETVQEYNPDRWKDEWKATNSLPPMVMVTLKLGDKANSSVIRETVTRVVSLPAKGVRREFQPWTSGQGMRPGAPGQPGQPGGQPGQPGQPDQPGGQPGQPGLPAFKFGR